MARLPAEGAPSVSAFGGWAAAHSVASGTGQADGATAAPCSSSASDRWYFAAGSSALGADERLVVSNPFLDEAVVRIVFFTPRGPTAKAGLADVAVPAGRSVAVAVNDYILRQPVLGAEVATRRGRVVAWREQLSRDPFSGAVLALGARRPAANWYFPDGALGEAYDERIALLNPSGREALVTVTLASSDRVVQPPELVELSLPPGTARELALRSAVPPPRRGVAVGAVVRSVNGVELVAERTVAYEGQGLAAEVGATRRDRAWHLGPAARRPGRDAVVVLNPGTRDARVRVLLLRAGAPPLAPPALSGVEVRAGLCVRLPVDRWTQGAPMGAAVTSDTAIVAERSSYSREGSDPAASMGTPLAPARR